jgi:hypothetical protein
MYLKLFIITYVSFNNNLLFSIVLNLVIYPFYQSVRGIYNNIYSFSSESHCMFAHDFVEIQTDVYAKYLILTVYKVSFFCTARWELNWFYRRNYDHWKMYEERWLGQVQHDLALYLSLDTLFLADSYISTIHYIMLLTNNCNGRVPIVFLII